MRKFIVAAAIIFFSSHAFAEQHICNIDGVLYSAIAWNTETREAKVKLFLDREKKGKLVAVTEKSDGTKSYNFIFELEEKPSKQETAEILVFSPERGKFRAIGVTRSDVKDLDGNMIKTIQTDLGNSPATCMSM